MEVKKIDSTDLVIWVKGLSRFKGEINGSAHRFVVTEVDKAVKGQRLRLGVEGIKKYGLYKSRTRTNQTSEPLRF